MPRTFVGPLALAGVSWPFLRFGVGFGGVIGGQLVGEFRVSIGMVGEAHGKLSVGQGTGNR